VGARAAGPSRRPTTRRAGLRGGAALALALGLAGPASSQSAGSAGAEVRVFQFQPGTLEVRPGVRVTWTNRDDIAHTATSGAPGRPDGRFDVRLDGKGASGSFLFPDPGVYPYFCARHPSMRGEVIVR
jgi:plastocyanin